MNIMTAEDIRYSIKGKTLLEIPSFEIEQGKVIGIIGPNGAGKSTFLKVLSLLLKPNSGDIYYKGNKIMPNKRLEIRRKMSIVFQDSLLLDGTVYWNMEIGLRLRNVEEKERKKRIEDWLKRLNIMHLKNQHISTLSGGEAQRVNIARAMALEPEILFLDEPLSYLDQPTKEGLVVDLYKILKSNGVTTFFVSHDFREMLYLSDIACVMLNGKIMQKACPLDILNKPKSIHIAGFVGIDNIFKGKISLIKADRYYIRLYEGDTILAHGSFDYNVGNEVNIAIRSENVSIVNGDFASPNTYSGKVMEIYPTGYGWKCKINVFNETLILNLDKNNVNAVNVNDKIFVNIRPEDVYLIPLDML